jgi:hypothetical protein
MEAVIGEVVGMESESLRDNVHFGKFNIMVFWRERRGIMVRSGEVAKLERHEN